MALSTIERTDFGAYPMTSEGARDTTTVPVDFAGQRFSPGQNRHWGILPAGLERVGKSGRIVAQKTQIRMRYFWDDYPVIKLGSHWSDVGGAIGKVYVVQTATKVLERLLLMTTDPGDLVLDPTCGSGTTAYVAEQWGRRWITIDTSRVALALARSRIMGARYPYYLLADSPEGQHKEAELSRKAPTDTPTYDDIRQGFVYERVPHITLKSIANNAEIDTIYEQKQPPVEEALATLNDALRDHPTPFAVATGGRKGRRVGIHGPERYDGHPAFRRIRPCQRPPRMGSPVGACRGLATPQRRTPVTASGRARIARQREIDACIAARAEYEYLYDKPYEDRSKTRVAGPFTVESLSASPHRRPRRERRAHRRRGRHGLGGGRVPPGLCPHDPGEPAHRWRTAGKQGRPHRVLVAGTVARRSGLRGGPLP